MTEIAEYLAPLSTLDDDKIYSEIHEQQFWDANQEESKSERSLVSEEAIRDEDVDFERVYQKLLIDGYYETKSYLGQRGNMGRFEMNLSKKNSINKIFIVH